MLLDPCYTRAVEPQQPALIPSRLGANPSAQVVSAMNAFWPGNAVPPRSCFSMRIIALGMGLLAGCGSSSSPSGPVAPSNLAYPVASLKATVGVAIATDT